MAIGDRPYSSKRTYPDMNTAQTRCANILANRAKNVIEDGTTIADGQWRLRQVSDNFIKTAYTLDRVMGWIMTAIALAMAIAGIYMFYGFTRGTYQLNDLLIHLVFISAIGAIAARIRIRLLFRMNQFDRENFRRSELRSKLCYTPYDIWIGASFDTRTTIDEFDLPQDDFIMLPLPF